MNSCPEIEENSTAVEMISDDK